MLSFVNHLHAQHCPTYEFYRGEKVPCFEKVERYDYVIEALKANGHEVSFATSSADEVLPQVHSQRYLDFFLGHFLPQNFFNRLAAFCSDLSRCIHT